MTGTAKEMTLGRKHTALMLPALVVLTIATATSAQAQSAIGVPFVGNNHLSFYVTELSRDGIGKERAAVFGGVYGRRFNRAAPVQVSMVLRAAARALEGTQDGIVDAGLTLAATHAVKAIDGLNITGAAGFKAVVWGYESPAQETSDLGRTIVGLPLSAGMAYDVRMGGATIAPFAALNGTYSRETDFVNGERVTWDSGWQLGQSAGLSVRFRETVLSLSGIRNERGLPNNNRVVFTAGMSW